MDTEKRSTKIKVIIIACIILLFIVWIARSFTNEKAAPLPLPTVVVDKPKVLKITEYATQTGTMVAFNSVNLVARVEGYLQSIHFTDGSVVKKDDELFVIEPKPYLEQLKAAQATVAVQKADYAYSKAEYERQQRMYKQNATSLNNVEKWRAKLEQSQAEIEKTVANAENASITYSYTHIFAPFAGRIGRHLVDVGNLVGHGEATSLATIEQIAPIYVYFNLNEIDLIKIRKAARDQGFKPSDLNSIPVYVEMQTETGYPHKGYLDFVNTGLNASTGTMEFRAVLPNKEFNLLPGLFVRVRIPISKPEPQLTVPVDAIQYDQLGAYVMSVDANNRVLIKRVTTGALEQGRQAINKGLIAEDHVIVSGLQNAVPGNQVNAIPNEKEHK